MRKRKPKKILVLPIKTSKRAILVPIYLDTHTGEFSSEVGGIVYRDWSLVTIRSAMLADAQLQDDGPCIENA